MRKLHKILLKRERERAFKQKNILFMYARSHSFINNNNKKKSFFLLYSFINNCFCCIYYLKNKKYGNYI